MQNLQNISNLAGIGVGVSKSISPLVTYIKSLSGLVAYYPMDEPSGTVCTNRAPATLGTLDGTTTGATVNQAGQVGKAYAFDGVNDGIAIPDTNLISDATSLSVVVLIKTNNTTQDHYILGQGTGTTGIILFADDVSSASGRTNTFRVAVTEDAASGGSTVATDSATNSNQGVWVMVSFTFEAGNALGFRLYINGVLDVNSPANASAIANAGKLNSNICIGERVDGAMDANALIQHVAFFNSVLTPEQILKMAQLAGLA